MVKTKRRIFGLTQYYPVDQKQKVVWIDQGSPRKVDVESGGLTGLTGFYLNQHWSELEGQGYKIERREPDRRGGRQPGAGRPARGEPIVRVKVSAEIHQQLSAAAYEAGQKLGESLSMQDFLTALLDKQRSPEQLSGLLEQLYQWSAPWGWLSLRQSDIEKLDRLIGQVQDLTDLRVNRANLISAIVLAEVPE